MAILTTRSTDSNPSANLVDENGVALTDGFPAIGTPTPTSVVPLMLLMRLRLHAVLFWGTILLMQTIP